jgi:hypothetical protein
MMRHAICYDVGTNDLPCPARAEVSVSAKQIRRELDQLRSVHRELGQRIDRLGELLITGADDRRLGGENPPERIEERPDPTPPPPLPPGWSGGSGDWWPKSKARRSSVKTR